MVHESHTLLSAAEASRNYRQRVSLSSLEPLASTVDCAERWQMGRAAGHMLQGRDPGTGNM